MLCVESVIKLVVLCWTVVQVFFFNDTATTEIYTLSLHDALPIFDLQTKQVSLLKEINKLNKVRNLFAKELGIIITQ